jgi:hypothetical protein
VETDTCAGTECDNIDERTSSFAPHKIGRDRVNAKSKIKNQREKVNEESSQIKKRFDENVE